MKLIPPGEIERLNKVIAKELSENDELGCEYTYVAALKGELAEAEKDTQRLEWLIQHEEFVTKNDEGYYVLSKLGYFGSPREAIDAAMKESNA